MAAGYFFQTETQEKVSHGNSRQTVSRCNSIDLNRTNFGTQVVVLSNSQHFSSHVGTLPGLNQCKAN